MLFFVCLLVPQQKVHLGSDGNEKLVQICFIYLLYTLLHSYSLKSKFWKGQNLNELYFGVFHKNIVE